MNATSDILFERRGVAGVVTLNRPQALNAITHAMVLALARRLEDWATDAEVTRIIITAAGDRAFCAGGDIRALYDLGRARRYADALDFWRDEYRLNTLIKRYPKPYVALVDGIVMGGGVGVSVHGSHRIAGDRFQFAMPEVGIGFFPDVGATWFLPQLPGETGAYCALTGDRLRADEAVATGIATHRVASARCSDLLEALCRAEPVDTTLAGFMENGDATAFKERRVAVDRWFAAQRVADVLALLDREAALQTPVGAFAAATATTMRGKSPTSLAVALQQMRRGKHLSFEECMRTEFRIVSRIIHGHDFYEGVRAVIIDKDNAPRWRPATLGEVSQAEVERYFAGLGRDELPLP